MADDVVVYTDGGRTYRIMGLDAKATSIGNAVTEAHRLIGDLAEAARSALDEWRGPHAVTFAEEANDALDKLVSVYSGLWQARSVVQNFPDPGVSGGFTNALEVVMGLFGAQLMVPEETGRVAADPPKLQGFAQVADGVHGSCAGLADDVNLDGVTAEVSWTRGLTETEMQDRIDLGADPVVLSQEEVTETEALLDVGSVIELDSPDAEVTSAQEACQVSGELAAAVAIAFENADEYLLALLEDYPDLADELVAGFTDQEIGGESALIILLAYFDMFDEAKTGDTDGEVSMDDLWQMACSTELPDYVSQAAQYLHDHPQLFGLIETMNDGMDYARDIWGGNGDGKISVDDVETFIEFNDQLTVLDQNFDAFDTAANPDEPGDGEISDGDLEALADGDGELAAAASWLLDHGGAWTRLAWYERAKHGFTGEKFGEQHITEGSLTLLTVDQHVYADDPSGAADFVDRRFETLMNADRGGAADPDAMYALFDNALTNSDQSGELMQRVITEVADDGTIHNSGLPLAFANGATANMDVLDGNINDPSSHVGPGQTVPDDVRQGYLDTHDFLREVSRDADAAVRLREGFHYHGMSETVDADGSGSDRTERLRELGRMQAFLTEAQENAATGTALADLQAAAEGAGLGPSVGSFGDHALGYVPYLGTVNEIAGAMGVSGGDSVDWLLGQMGVTSEDAFDELSEAEKAYHLNLAQDNLDRAEWLVTDLYQSDPAAFREAAEGQPFVDDDGSLLDTMDADERQAFREWATALVGQTDPPSPMTADRNAVGDGSDDVLRPDHGISISDRDGTGYEDGD